MEKISEQTTLRKELMRLNKKLLEAENESRPMHELENIRQQIADITYQLSSDTRKIKDIP